MVCARITALWPVTSAARDIAAKSGSRALPSAAELASSAVMVSKRSLPGPVDAAEEAPVYGKP